MKRLFKKPAGQSMVEYGLILVLVAVVIILVVSVFGGRVSAMYNNILTHLSIDGGAMTIPAISSDFSDRIMAFYEDNGHWPRSWGSYAYTDIGFYPADWDEPVEGIYWRPHGRDFGLANRSGDNIEIYVEDLSGNRKHLYNGWSIWCVPATDICYFHDIDSGNEVDITTIEIVYTE
ncbi:MAG: Flp family type IVb pilin [Anaerolineaceae bacterium]|nr:Flp family type IVb pilin [Anaerolineaceae bacterium]